MSEALNVKLGEALPLSWTAPDGASGLFPQAFVFDSANNSVAGSPFDLSEVASDGRYTAQTTPDEFTPGVVGTFTALYVAFSDGAHTIEDTSYERDQDSFSVRDFVNEVWDEILQGNTHNINNSAGKILRQLKEGIGNVLDEGDFRAGSTPTSAVLALTAPAADASLPGSLLVDNVQQTFWVITAYDGATKIATIAPDRGITPANGDAYIVAGSVFSVPIGDQLAVIENAVLNATGADHVAPGTIGQLLDRVLGFATQDNVMLDGGPNATDATVPDYDSAGLMLEGRMRTFRTAANRAAATPGNVGIQAGELYRQLITATASTAGQADSYVSDRDV